MIVDKDKNIRIPVPGEEGKHIGDKIRTVIVSGDEGIKGLYCHEHKRIIAYVFAKNKDWTTEKADQVVAEYVKDTKSIAVVQLDQQDDFMKLVVTKQDSSVEEYLPNSPSFDLTEEIEEYTMGYEKARGDGQGTGGSRQGDGGATLCVCPECGAEVKHEKGTPCKDVPCPKCGVAMVGKSEKSSEVGSTESVEVIKVDKTKHLVYGIFLVPEKADWDGDVISSDDIEKVAHGFVADYRTIDEMHKNIITADIVESAIAWVDDLDFHGKKLSKGTWFGAIKVKDGKVWDKIQAGEYKAFSVRIAGVREPIEEGAE